MQAHATATRLHNIVQFSRPYGVCGACASRRIHMYICIYIHIYICIMHIYIYTTEQAVVVFGPTQNDNSHEDGVFACPGYIGSPTAGMSCCGFYCTAGIREDHTVVVFGPSLLLKCQQSQARSSTCLYWRISKSFQRGSIQLPEVWALSWTRLGPASWPCRTVPCHAAVCQNEVVCLRPRAPAHS